MCENSAEKIYGEMKLLYHQNQFQSLKALYQEMEKRHADSKLFGEVKHLYEEILIVEKETIRNQLLEAEKENQENIASLNILNREYDDISGITWYRQPYFAHRMNTNRVSIYIGELDGSPSLRMKMSYTAEYWIFFEKIYFSFDNDRKKIIYDLEKDRGADSNSGGVWGWIDITVTSDMELFLREFSRSENAKMKFSGKYTRVRTLTSEEKQGIQDVLNGYDALIRESSEVR